MDRIIGSSRIEIDGAGKILCSVSGSDRVQRREVDPRTTVANLVDALAGMSLEIARRGDTTDESQPGADRAGSRGRDER